jgi:hypothetical protein
VARPHARPALQGRCGPCLCVVGVPCAVWPAPRAAAATSFSFRRRADLLTTDLQCPPFPPSGIGLTSRRQIRTGGQPPGCCRRLPPLPRSTQPSSCPRCRGTTADLDPATGGAVSPQGATRLVVAPRGGATGPYGRLSSALGSPSPLSDLSLTDIFLPLLQVVVAVMVMAGAAGYLPRQYT